MFGPHLILDGSQCDTQKLGDRILIEQMLTDYPAAIGMTRIGGPYMFEYQAPDPAYSGVSGIVVIAESHIAIHTFPALDYFSMDIFSCKNFDHEHAIRYIEAALDVKRMDRMLVQRGLSFRGPHHGAEGATDELIAAAEARLAAGIISNETVTPAEAAVARAQLIARQTPAEPTGATGGGHMIWPRYGVTPDLGTYGASATVPLPAREEPATGVDCAPCARDGAHVSALDGVANAPTDAQGRALPPTEPVQVNPTASISGLLDKLGGLGTSGRALSRALGEWERLVRDPECTVVLALATPVVAEGLREMLVHTIEQRYVDIVVASAADLIADLHESLGHFHYADGDIPVASDADRAHTTAFIARFAATFVAEHPADSLSGRDLARALGEALPTRAPRKGILQAAAAVGVAVYCPDLATGPIGQALLAARTADGAVVRLNPLDDVTALARDLAARPREGLIAVGTGAADALVRQARTLAPDTALAGDITIGVSGNVRTTPVEHAVVVATEATLALPLLITSLAQRLPSTRGARAGRGPAHSRQYAPTEEHAMA